MARVATREPAVAFRIQRTRKMLLIECRNPVDAATIRRRGERFLTSKSGRGHGIGLQSIHNIVSRAKGTCSFSIEEGTFLARITLPYGEETR